MTEPHIEMFTLPPLEDVEYWEKFIAAGLHQPMSPEERAEIDAEIAAEQAGPDSWTPIDLADQQYAIPPDPPTILGLLYKGRRHVLSGAPETAKTLVAYILLLTAIQQNMPVAVIDFEMGPVATRRLLTELGATTDELAAIHYVAPTTPPNGHLERLANHGTQLVLIDAAIGAYDATDLDDNKRQDAEKFAGTWVRPLWEAGIATLLIDHVTKDTASRGKFTIGSERKLGSADVHLGLEALKTISRGGDGIIKVHVHKDRPGFLPRPTATIIDLTSDPETHHINWELREPLPTETDSGEFRHTIYMERISRYMQQNPDHLYSKNELEEGVEGKRDHIRTALQELIDDEHVLAVEHGKWLKYHLVRPFAPSSPQFAPGEPEPNLAPFAPPLQGAKGEGRTLEGEPNQSSPRANLDVYDPEIQKLLDKEIPF